MPRPIKIGPRGPTAADLKKTGLTGRIIVKTNASQSSKDVAELRRRVPVAILQDHQERAAQIQARLRAVTLAEYSKTGTGRMSRGIFARVQKIENGAAIVVGMINYRESNFLTNLGGRGYFKEFPVGPYRIYAEGAEGIDQRVDPLSGKVTQISGRQSMKSLRRFGQVGRLKVPRQNVIFEAFRKHGGGESRRPVEVLAGGGRDPFDFSIDRKDAAFFYPLWVNHPGFARDVISDTVAQENAKIIREVQELVRFHHTNLGGGKFRKERLPASRQDQYVTTAVSNVIPLTSLTVTLTRKKIGYGSVEGAGLDRLNRATK